MPWRDPNLPEWLQVLGQYLYAPVLAFAVSLLRGLHAGGKPMKSLMEASIVGFITLGLVPLLRYFSMPEDLSVFAGSAIAFMGVDWLRSRIDKASRIIIDKWGDKP